jgi:hypothetical protein
MFITIERWTRYDLFSEKISELNDTNRKITKTAIFIFIEMTTSTVPHDFFLHNYTNSFDRLLADRSVVEFVRQILMMTYRWSLKKTVGVTSQRLPTVSFQDRFSRNFVVNNNANAQQHQLFRCSSFNSLLKVIPKTIFYDVCHSVTPLRFVFRSMQNICGVLKWTEKRGIPRLVGVCCCSLSKLPEPVVCCTSCLDQRSEHWKRIIWTWNGFIHSFVWN